MISDKLTMRLTARCFSLLHLPSGRSKHFSFILDGYRVLSEGWNQTFKTHPLAAKFGHRFSAIHAELDAIRKFPMENSYLKFCTMVNVRIMADGTIGLSKPCVHCQKLLDAFGLHDIYYSTPEGFKCLH